MKINDRYFGFEKIGRRTGMPFIYIDIVNDNAERNIEKSKDDKKTDKTKWKEFDVEQMIADIERESPVKNISFKGATESCVDLVSLMNRLVKKGYFINVDSCDSFFPDEIFRSATSISYKISSPSEKNATASKDNVHRIIRKYDFQSDFIMNVGTKEDIAEVVENYQLFARKNDDFNLYVSVDAKDKLLVKKLKEAVFSHSLSKIRIIEG